MLEVGGLEVGLVSVPSEAPPSALVLPPRLGGAVPPPLDAAMGAWVEASHRSGSLVCSVCVGAFQLAELGLLRGRPATTHWAMADELARRFPDVRVDADRILVDDGDIVTAGGLMAWTDLALLLIGRFAGPGAVSSTARAFLVDPGGREQRFYRTFAPARDHGDEAILEVQRWLQTRIGQASPVARMAEVAHLGERTFLRRFQRATGLRPTAYVQALAVGRAREFLEQTEMSQQEVAWAVGYEDPKAFRRIFGRLVGLGPGEYRKRFGTGSRR